MNGKKEARRSANQQRATQGGVVRNPIDTIPDYFGLLIAVGFGWPFLWAAMW